MFAAHDTVLVVALFFGLLVFALAYLYTGLLLLVMHPRAWERLKQLVGGSHRHD